MRAGDLSTFQGGTFIHILLLAEDGDPNCHACSVLAHNFKGYIIDFCMAGQITRQFLDERRPDIVVVDCRPDCNSCRRFFSLLEGCADRPATIMIADLPELGRLEDYFAAQIDDIILKPYQDRELLTRVKIAAERRKSRTGLPEKNVAYDPELMEKMKLESLSLLAGGIAHDLNNYLAVILGSISLARAMPPDPENFLKVLDRIEKTTMQAKDLGNNLLTFSRGGSPVKKTFRLEQLLHDAAAFALDGTDVRGCFSIAGDLRPVVGDAAQIMQVLNNVLLNAVQAMAGGGIVHIKAVNHNLEQSASKAGMPPAGKDYVKITIQDEGPGIPAGFMDKIFNPFFTTRAKGYGLGLATVQVLVKRNNGFVEVQSREGEGTALHIYLPAGISGQEGRF